MKAKKLIKLMDRLIKQDHLYSPEKLREMKSQVKILKEEIAKIEAQTSKGFGKK
jgi:uncharacterized small protein (DUF1192 family)